MTIRNRVTLWYAVAILISLFFLGGGMYFELVYERNQTQRLGRPLEPIEEELGEVIFYFVVPAMILVVAGGWWLLRRSLLPLDRLAAAAERIGLENIQNPLPRTFNGDEVDRLSQVVNEMNQRLSIAMKEIHEFTLHASHELKTPLTVLHSEIETALEKSPIDQRESLASQLDEIQRLTRIVEGLGFVARTNSGQMSLAQEPVPFHEILKDTADDAMILAQSKKVSVELQGIEPAWVLGDRHRLRQMLLNLVDNASKYNIPGGSVLIRSSVTASTVTTEIANTGNGIRQEDLPHLFKKFYRGSSKSPPDPDGVGLGLSIAQSIAKIHLGDITIDSARPGWTTVRVFLPRIQSPSD